MPGGLRRWPSGLLQLGDIDRRKSWKKRGKKKRHKINDISYYLSHDDHDYYDYDLAFFYDTMPGLPVFI